MARRVRLLGGFVAALVLADVVLLLATGAAPVRPRTALAAGLLAVTLALVADGSARREPGRRPALLYSGLACGVPLALGLLLGDFAAATSTGPVLDRVAAAALWGGLTGVCLLPFGYPDGWLPQERPARTAASAAFGPALVLPVVAAGLGLAGLAPPDADPASGVTWLPLLAAAVATVPLAGHYRESSALRRRVLAAFAVPSVAFPVALVAVPAGPVGVVLLGLAAALYPAAFGYGMLRYRFYRVDRPGVRTSAYVLATLILLAGCGAVLALLDHLVEVPRQVSVGLAVLLTATVFGRLRRRLRSALLGLTGRRRRAGEATVAAFADRLRDEVAVGEVSDDLRGTVETLVGPTSSLVWLAGPR